MGACHSVEIPFVFGTHDQPGVRDWTGHGEAADRLSAQMLAAWTQFARSGDPSTPGLAWPAFDAASKPTMWFDGIPAPSRLRPRSRSPRSRRPARPNRLRRSVQPTRIDWPPSTGSSTPVTNAASSDARYSAALATSQAEPWCPSGTREARADAELGAITPAARAGRSTAIGVSMSPGMMALERMLKRALLDAIDCVSAFTPALEIL